jgi:hypothetical protein
VEIKLTSGKATTNKDDEAFPLKPMQEAGNQAVPGIDS